MTKCSYSEKMINKSNLCKVIELNKILLPNVKSKIESLQFEVGFKRNPIQAIKNELSKETEVILMPSPVDNFGGCIVHKNGRFYTVINTAKPRVYENLTWAHEFYHFKYEKELIKENQNKTLYSNANDNEYERAAYLFSTELLINSVEVIDQIQHLLFVANKLNKKVRVLDVIFHLMSTSEVTYKAIVMKLAQMNILSIEDAEEFIDYDYYNHLPHDFDFSLLEPSRTIKFDNITHEYFMNEEFLNRVDIDDLKSMYSYYNDIQSSIQQQNK